MSWNRATVPDGIGSVPEAAAGVSHAPPDGCPALAPDQPPLRIFVGVAELLFLEAFANHLDHTPGLTVIAKATRGQQAVSACLERRPDLIVLDIDLPELSGVGIARRLQAGGTCAPIILLLSDSHDARHVAAAWAAGVRGFMIKQGSWDELVHAIRTVPAGSVFVDSRLARDLVPGRGSRAGNGPSRRPDCARAGCHPAVRPGLYEQGNRAPARHVRTFGREAQGACGPEARPADPGSIVRYGIVQGWFEEA